jgi:hypothetical protein
MVNEIGMDRLDAVTFDLEGEDQDPFSADDYYLDVDGKPRYEGVESFLASRGSSIPHGEPAMSPPRRPPAGRQWDGDHLCVT